MANQVTKDFDYLEIEGLGTFKPSGSGGGGAVDSVNGKTGVVVLDASDVGALPDDTPIPAAVTEQTVSGWGFTKNTGTYSKPSGGIPKSDLASAVQTSLSKADTALQTAPVTSVNNKTGAVTLTASDVGALPSSTSIPTKVSDLTNDSNFQTAAQVQSAIAAAAELPSGGTTGDFLRKTASGVAWETVQTWQGGSY